MTVHAGLTLFRLIGAGISQLSSRRGLEILPRHDSKHDAQHQRADLGDFDDRFLTRRRHRVQRANLHKSLCNQHQHVEKLSNHRRHDIPCAPATRQLL